MYVNPGATRNVPVDVDHVIGVASSGSIEVSLSGSPAVLAGVGDAVCVGWLVLRDVAVLRVCGVELLTELRFAIADSLPSR